MKQNRYEQYWNALKERVNNMQAGPLGDEEICRLTKKLITDLMDEVELKVDQENIKNEKTLTNKKTK